MMNLENGYMDSLYFSLYFYVCVCVCTCVKIFIIKSFLKFELQEISHRDYFVKLRLIIKLFQEQSAMVFCSQSFHWPRPYTPGLPPYSCHAAALCWPLPWRVPEVKRSTMSKGSGCKLSLLNVFRERSVS